MTNFIVNEQGKQIGVMLSLDEYQKLLEAQEELDSIHAYDAAKASDDEIIPFEQAVDEIEQNRE